MPVKSNGRQIHQSEKSCWRRDHDPVPDDDDGNVVCPFLFEELDALLTCENGAPTWKFYAIVASCVANGLAFAAGTPLTPGLLDAWEAGDLLLAVGVGGLFVDLAVVPPIMLDNLRYTIRCSKIETVDDPRTRTMTHRDNQGLAADYGPLPQLGAGTEKISATKLNTLQKLPMPEMGFWFVIFGIVYSPYIIMGMGVQSPTQNRLTAVANMVYASTLFQVYRAASIPIRTASALIATRIETLSNEVKRRADKEQDKKMARATFRDPPYWTWTKKMRKTKQQELEEGGEDKSVSQDDWTDKIANPCRKIIRDMDALSEDFAGSVVLNAVIALIGAPALLCLLLSPLMTELLDELGQRFGLSWLTSLGQGLFLFFFVVVLQSALTLVKAPAEVSTDADDLKDTLNKLRIKDLSAATHEKVFILECALANCNDGQGVGFCVLGTVIDMKTLKKVGLSLYSAAAAVLPFVIAHSNFGGGNATGLGTCEALTPGQIGVLMTRLSAEDGNCSLTNRTIGRQIKSHCIFPLRMTNRPLVYGIECVLRYASGELLT